MLTREHANSVLAYDADTGEFRWKVKVSSRGMPGQLAGTHDKDGYLIITIDRKRYRSARLAWFMETGKWPNGLVDHEDGDISNDRFKNLREANPTQNAINTRKPRMQKGATSKFKGVHLDAKGNWCAQIRVDGKKVWLGIHPTERHAAEAYLFSAIEHHGEFARAA